MLAFHLPTTVDKEPFILLKFLILHEFRGQIRGKEQNYGHSISYDLVAKLYIWGYLTEL